MFDNSPSTGDWLDPTPEMLDTNLFDAIWRVIKTWDVNVPHAYSGYMGAAGNHARAIYDAITPLYASPHPCTDCDKLREEVERLRGVLDRIYMEDRRIVERWRQSLATGDSHLDETIVLGRYGEIARAALNGGKDD